LVPIGCNRLIICCGYCIRSIFFSVGGERQ
jgi:hypothetical protein